MRPFIFLFLLVVSVACSPSGPVTPPDSPPRVTPDQVTLPPAWTDTPDPAGFSGSPAPEDAPPESEIDTELIDSGYEERGMIAFVSDEAGKKQIFSIGPDGSGRTKLTDGDYFDTSPTWSNDGSRLAFLRAEAEHENQPQRSSVFIMEPDGSGLLELTSDLDFELASIAWAPDDGAIAFSAGLLENDRVFSGSNIYAVDVGSRQSTLVAETSPSNVGCSQPSWSPDSYHMVFRCRAMMNSGVVLGDKDGSGTFGADIPSDRAIWLPSGEKIAARGGMSCLIAEIAAGYMLQSGEGGEMQLACMEDQFYPQGYEDMAVYALHWSRLVDGRVILQSPELMQVVDLERGSVTRLELNFADVESQVSWGPSEASVVFTYFDGNDYELGIIDLASGDVFTLTDNEFDDLMPAWRPVE